MKASQISKMSMTMPISRELLWGYKIDDRYTRRGSWSQIPLTAEEQATYDEGVELLRRLEANPYFYRGSGEHGPEVEKPYRMSVVWLETEDEWRARCEQLDKDGVV